MYINTKHIHQQKEENQISQFTTIVYTLYT